MPTECCIYQIKSGISGKTYIGSATNFSHRKSMHLCQLRKNKHHSILLQRSYNKYGEDSFVFEILLYCDKEMLLYYEQTLIDGFRPEYNTCSIAGNTVGYKHTEETKRKISAANAGKSHGTFSDEHRKKLSKSMTGRIPWNKGIPRTVEERNKISKSHIGLRPTEETRQKLSESQLGRKPTYGFKGHKHDEEYSKMLGELNRKHLAGRWKKKDLVEQGDV